MRRLVIIGAGGHGREVLDVVEAINSVNPTYEVVGFLADRNGVYEPLSRRSVNIIGTSELLDSLDADYFVAIGNPRPRAVIDRRCIAVGRDAPVLIHPSASVGADVELGPGSVVMAGARITTNVRGGRYLHVNVNATLSHDTRFGDYVTISPGCNVSGGVDLGDGVYLGTGAIVVPGIRIGRNTMVGAGAVVIRDLPEAVTAVGIPARVIAHRGTEDLLPAVN